MRRILAGISLLFIIAVILSVYGPWDFLGAYTKINVADKYLSDDMQISATGDVICKEIKNDKTVYYIKNATIDCEYGRLKNTSFIFKFDSDTIPNKSKINIDGDIALFSVATNEGGYDMKSYYNSLGYYFEVTNVSINSIETRSFNNDFFYRVDRKIQKVYEKYLPSEEAGLMASVALGNKGELDQELKSLFTMAGIAHILAVSGLHISVVCMSIYRLLRRHGFSFIKASVVSTTVAIFYGNIAGGSVSSIRAIGMFLIYLIANVLGESYDLITALSVMAVYLLIQNPLYIKNGSFIFSFGAILGIFYIASPLTKKLLLISNCSKRLIKSYDGKFWKIKSKYVNTFTHWILSSILFTFGINVAMLPIVTNMYYETPLYSPIINFLVLPAMPVLLGFGLIGGILGTIFLPLGYPFLIVCHFIIYSMEFLADTFSKLPISLVCVGRKSMLHVAIYYILLLAIINGEKLKSYFFPVDSSINPRVYLKRLKKSLLLSVLLLLCVEALWLVPIKKGFEIDILDVGQGDGIYIDSGDGVRFFIDGGSTSSDAIGKYTILPFLKYKGVSRIDYWFISHTDLDHVSGIIELLEAGYDIRNIVLTSEILRDDTLDTILSLADKNKTNIIYMKQGEIIGTKHIRFKCVFPNPKIQSDDVNALSLSLLMEYDKNIDGVIDYSAFFGGDIGEEQEMIIAESDLIENIDLLKVSHHGSRFSSNQLFLDKLSPEIAVISCSKRNRYGHPSDEAIERIKTVTENIYYTMYSGRVRINEKGLNFFVKN